MHLLIVMYLYEIDLVLQNVGLYSKFGLNESCLGEWFLEELIRLFELSLLMMKRVCCNSFAFLEIGYLKSTDLGMK